MFSFQTFARVAVLLQLATSLAAVPLYTLPTTESHSLVRRTKNGFYMVTNPSVAAGELTMNCKEFRLYIKFGDGQKTREKSYSTQCSSHSFTWTEALDNDIGKQFQTGALDEMVKDGRGGQTSGLGGNKKEWYYVNLGPDYDQALAKGQKIYQTGGDAIEGVSNAVEAHKKAVKAEEAEKAEKAKAAKKAEDALVDATKKLSVQDNAGQRAKPVKKASTDTTTSGSHSHATAPKVQPDAGSGSGVAASSSAPQTAAAAKEAYDKAIADGIAKMKAVLLQEGVKIPKV